MAKHELTIEDNGSGWRRAVCSCGWRYKSRITEETARKIFGQHRRDITGLTPLEIQLYDALNDAHAHLEYCGYGDKWERECAKEAQLEQKIQAAIDAADAKEDA